MGETYRGLTIRIGGDTTPLKRALESVTKDAGVLGRELNKSTKALRTDPTSLTAMKVKMEALSAQAVNLYSKFHILDGAVTQLGTNDAIERARARFAHTGETVGILGERYNECNAKLEQLNRELKNTPDASARYKEIEAAMERLRKEQQMLQGSLSDAKQLTMFEDAKAEMEATRVSARRLAEQYAMLHERELELSHSDAFKGAAAEIRIVDTAAGNLDDTLRRVDRSLEMDPKNLTLAALKFDLLSEKAEGAEEKARQLRVQLAEFDARGITKAANSTKDAETSFQRASEQLKREQAEVSELEGKMRALQKTMNGFWAGEKAQPGYSKQASQAKREYTDLREEIVRTNSELREHRALLQDAGKTFDTAHEVRELKQVQTALGEVEAEAKQARSALETTSNIHRSFASSLTNIGLSLSTTLTPAMYMFGQYSIQSATDIDAAFRDMKKTVNGTDEDFARLKDSAESFARTHVTSADQMLEIQALGGQLGISVDALDEFATVVSNLSIATNLDSETAATELGQLANITHMTTDEYSRFGDALVRLGNNSATQESNIMDIASRIGSMGTIVGMSVPQILAWSDAVASTGQNSEAAGTAISKTLSDIEGAVAEGGDALQGFADVAGMSADEFAAAWESSPSDALHSFIDGLTRLDEEGGSVDATLESLGITSVRQKQAIEGLVQVNKTAADGTNVLTDALQMSQDAWDGVSDSWGQAGDAAYEANQKSEGFSGKLQILKNNAQQLGEAVATTLVPFLDKAADAVRKLTEWFTGLPDGMQRTLVGVMAIGAAAGPFMTFLGAIIPMMDKFTANIRAGGDAWSTTVRAMKGADGAATAMETVATAGGKAGKETEKAAGKVSSGFKRMGQSAKIAAGSMLSIGASMAVLTAVGVAVGILVDKISGYVEEQKEAERSAQLASDALEAESRMMLEFGNTAEDAGNKADGSFKTMRQRLEELEQSSEEIQDSLDQFNQSAEDRFSTTEASIGQINNWVGTVGKLSGKVEEGTDGWYELKTAVDQLNQSLGTDYIVNATGQLTDQDGVVVDLTDDLYRLADAKKASLKMEAISGTLTDAYKEQYELEKQVEEERKAAEKAESDYETAKANGSSYGQLKIDAETARRDYENDKAKLDALNGSVERYEEDLNEATAAQYTATQSAEDFARALEEAGSETSFEDLAGRLGMDTETLTKALDDAAISTREFADIGVENFARMYEASGGDMARIKEQLEYLENLHIDPKLVTVEDDGTLSFAGKELENLATFQIGDKVYHVSSDGTVLDEKGEVVALNQFALADKVFHSEDEGTTQLKTGEVRDLSDQIQMTPDGNFVITSNTGEQISQVQELHSQLDRIAGKVVQYVIESKRQTTNAAGGFIEGHATGGYIVDRPTVVATTGNVMHVAGEAGAEWYEPHSRGIIPLSNTRYVRPFAHATASEMVPMLERPITRALRSQFGDWDDYMAAQSAIVDNTGAMDRMLASSDIAAETVAAFMRMNGAGAFGNVDVSAITARLDAIEAAIPQAQAPDTSWVPVMMEHLDALVESMQGMTVTMDTGEVVGAVASSVRRSAKMDRR